MTTRKRKITLLSALGWGLIGAFGLLALLAPVIAPPVSPQQPYLIPRDGFSPVPQAPGAVRQSRPPPMPVS